MTNPKLGSSTLTRTKKQGKKGSKIGERKGEGAERKEKDV